jgi:hypothetical protein
LVTYGEGVGVNALFTLLLLAKPALYPTILLKFAGNVTIGLNDCVGNTKEGDGAVKPEGKFAAVGNK